MTLQSSGAITLANLQTEFGGSNPISLGEYYRNGAYVPSSATGVPASGAISLSNFYGASNIVTETITVTEHVYHDSWMGSYYGFSLYGGSRSPTTFRGVNIVRLYIQDYFDIQAYVVLSGNRSQSFFTTVNFQDVGALASSSAAYSYISGDNTTQWVWTIGSKPARWDGSGTSTVVFTY